MRRTEADREKERAWNTWCRYSNRISGAFLWGSFNKCSQNTVLIKAYKSFFCKSMITHTEFGGGNRAFHSTSPSKHSLHTHSEHPHLKQITYNTHISNKSFKNISKQKFSAREEKFHHQRASVFHRDVVGHPGCAISTVTYKRKINKIVLVSGVYLRGGTLSGTSGLNSPFFIHRCI